MTDLIREYLPTAPDAGLYVAPDIPPKKLAAAVGDYAESVAPGDVVALFDATRLGSAKDGAVFLADRLVFQNNDLQTPRVVRYGDMVGVRATSSFLGGARVEIDVNQGRATVTETLDTSGRPAAAEYVERFLEQAMAQAAGSGFETKRASGETDMSAVESALADLRAAGVLSEQHYVSMLDVLQR